MQYLKGCFDPIPNQKMKYVSKIKQLQQLLQEVQAAAPELLSLVEQLGREARETVKPKLTGVGEVLRGLREEAVAVARDTTSEIKTDVDAAIAELADMFRAQGMEVEVIKVQPEPGKTIETEEDFLEAVQRLLSQAEQEGLDEENECACLSHEELIEVVGLQDVLITSQAETIQRLELQLSAQAKLSEGANARCTGLHEGIVSALELIGQLDILRAQEHLAFTLRQAGVSDCDVRG